MKTSEAINALKAIQKILDDNTNPRSTLLNYTLIKNKRALDAVLQQYNTTIENADDPLFNELIEKWREIAKPFARVDDAGNIVIDEAGAIVINSSKVLDYNLACESVLLNNDDYKNAFDRRNELVQHLMNQETDVTVYPIPLSLLPDKLDAIYLDVLFPFIDDQK